MYTAPVSQAKLDGSLWGIAAYFNPVGYRSRKKNYDAFRKRLRMQGVPLIVAEAALGDAPFELADDDADIVLRFRTDSVLWQKERLLNLASTALPQECDKVVCLDTDVCFLRDDWKNALSEALTRYIVVQPYERIAQGKRDVIPTHDMRTVDDMTVAPGLSSAYSCALHENNTVGVLSGHPGYAVAMRRSLFDACGLYEKMIVGGGDSLFFGSCFGIRFEKNNYLGEQHCPVAEDAAPWSDNVATAVQGSVGHVAGDVVHLWHGDRNERFYAERRTFLTNFHPKKDIVTTKNGCVEWTGANPTLEQNVALYFSVRNEDGDAVQNTNVDALRTMLTSRREGINASVAAAAVSRPPGWRNPTMQEP